MNCYKKNFLIKVIAKIDFLNPWSELDIAIPPEITQNIMKEYPLSTPRDAFTSEVHIDAAKGEIRQNSIKFKEWLFESRNRDKRILLSRDAVTLEYDAYHTYEEFKSQFINLTGAIEKTFQNLQIKRLGLRYINEIAIPGPNPFNWKNYLNKNLLGILDVPEEKRHISRAFQVLELNFDEFNLKFQYGMHNPDFPAPIKKKIFVLDYDAYIDGLVMIDELPTQCEKFHNRIEYLFEKSITDRLRGIMNE